MRNDLARVGCPACAVLPRGGSPDRTAARHRRPSPNSSPIFAVC